MDLKVVEEAKIYTIYENNNFVSMGIPYDYYISKEDFFNLLPEQREDILIYAVVLDEEDYLELEQALVSHFSNLENDACYQYILDKVR